MSKISVLVSSEKQDNASRGMPEGATLNRSSRSRGQKVSIDSQTLAASIQQLTESLSETFASAQNVNGATLKTVVVNVEVSAEGGVSLIGSFNAGISGGLSLTFEL